jgi:diguanylate cyclase (GGDEF)-like protein
MRNRSELNFKYRMEGLQPDWIESHDGMAIFSALPPGKYTFLAMASNPSLLAYSSPVKIEIGILPPWWRNPWFYSLCVLVFLLLVGAGDWLRAQHLRQTRKRLEKLVRERTRDLEISREKLRIQANHDSLTGMLNRRGILRALAAEIDRARREQRSMVVALADLDDFKRINDTYGHLAGDEALRRFAAAVDAAIRSYDHAGRYGGEEFLLVLTEVPPEAAELRMAALHTSISMLQIHTRESRFVLNCSIGATVFDPSGPLQSVDTLLSVIDQALYAAKAAGRNCVVFHSEDSLHPCLEKLAAKA